MCKVDFCFFFFVYKTFLKSEEQYFLSTKNKYTVCPEVISKWVNRTATHCVETGKYYHDCPGDGPRDS